jgi:hypothetical protein
MALSDLTTTSVLRALAQFDELGREAFLQRYGFSAAAAGKAAAYFARFHTSSAFPPPEAAVLVYFISSPVIVTDRF